MIFLGIKYEPFSSPPPPQSLKLVSGAPGPCTADERGLEVNINSSGHILDLDSFRIILVPVACVVPEFPSVSFIIL